MEWGGVRWQNSTEPTPLWFLAGKGSWIRQSLEVTPHSKPNQMAIPDGTVHQQHLGRPGGEALKAGGGGRSEQMQKTPR